MVQTLPRMSMQSTEIYPVDVLNAARSGNPDAIARLIGRALAHQGILISGSVVGEHLTLQLTGDPIPDQQGVIPLIQRGLMRLGFANIRSVTLEAQGAADAEQSAHQWSYQFQILDSLNAPLEPQPEAESLVRVHVSDRSGSAALAIGPYRVQNTAHGHIVYRQSEQPLGRSPQRRFDPAQGTAIFGDEVPLDRQPETHDALEALAQDIPVEFYGENGLGKTSLLRHLAVSPFIQRQFRDGVFYHRAATQPAEDTLQDLFEYFYEWENSVYPIKPTDGERYDAFASLNGLMVADDVPEGGDVLFAQSGMTVLMSSDHQQMRFTGQSIPMRGLPVPDAIALIEQRLDRSLRDEAERQDAETLCRLLKGHPLRIVQTMGFLRDAVPPNTIEHRGHKDIPTTLRDLTKQLQEGINPDAVTIRAATTLPELERRVLAVLAVFEQVSLSVDHLKPLTGATSLDLTLQILRERGLVNADEIGYRLASNLIPYFQQIWDLSPWVERSLSYFTAWIQQQEENEDTAGAIHRLGHGSAPLWWMAHIASQQERWPEVLNLCRSVDHPLMLSKRWGRWGQLWELGLAAARSMGDGAAEAVAFHQLGSRALCLGDLFTAHTYLTEAVQRRIALGDDIGAAVSQHNLNILTAPNTQAVDSGMSAGLAQSSPPVSGVSVGRAQHPAQTVVPPGQPAGTPSSGIPSGTFPSGTFPANTSSNIETVSSTPADSGASSGAIAPVPSAQIGRPGTGEESNTAAAVTPSTASSTRLTPQSPASSIEESSGFEPESPPRVYAQATEARSFPAGWVAVSAIAAVFGGIGAFLTLTWDSSPVSVAPRSLSFPPQIFGVESNARQLTITNTGPESLELSAIEFSGGDRRDFEITDETCTQEALRPQEDCTVSIVFTPSESGSRSARLRIADRAGDHERFIQVRGISEMAQISTDKDALAFDPVLTGSGQPPTQTFTLTNDSAVTFSMGPALISGERTDAFAIAQDSCEGVSLSPNDRCTVEVAFTPPGSGIFEANFAIRDSTGEYTWLRPLIGTGELSEPDISPAGLPFNAEVIGQLSTDVVTMTNTGTSPLDISDISLTGDTANFSIRGNTCTRNSIEAGESCSVTVGFIPQSERNYAANLVVTDNAINSPRSIRLTGRGTRVAVPVVSPNPLMFGEQEVGTLQQESLAITNRGSQSIQVQSVSMPQNEDFSLVRESCTGSTLAAGGTCTVTIGFTPEAEGDHATTITIRDTATGSPRTIEVTGTGVALPSPQIISIEATPAEIPFGERARVCYRVSNVNQLSLQDGQGTVQSLDPASGCATVAPEQTTTFTLAAEGATGERVTRQVRIQVTEPDTTPPAMPTPLEPRNNQYVLCSATPSAKLQWTPVTDDSEPITYQIQLEQGLSAIQTEESPQTWTPVTQQTIQASEFNISPYIEPGRITYRWRVLAQDAAGNASQVSSWAYFRTCES